MAKAILLIVAYAMAVGTLVLSVKLVRANHDKPAPSGLLADCSDPPPNNNPGQ